MDAIPHIAFSVPPFTQLSEPSVGHKTEQPTNVIAILIPCFNEELTIGGVIEDFRRELPQAKIYVFDNNSTDRTVECAREKGALLLRERRQGKGFVVQSMFREIDADIYVMVDGDGTYPASSVHLLLEPVLNREADMVVGSRLNPASESRFRIVNRLGNYLFLWLTRTIFHTHIEDMLSGYRVFNRNMVKQLPLFSSGFEIETELTIKALEQNYRVIELPVDLASRPQGSHSKIRHVRDGMIIMNMIFSLARDYKPLTMFGTAGLFLTLIGFIPGMVVISEFLRTGLVPRLPSAVLAVGLVLSGLVVAMVGLVLHTIARRFQELNLQLQHLGREVSMERNGAQRQTDYAGHEFHHLHP
jgi:glycosyltransferase involved in cell wall biosynthesis